MIKAIIFDMDGVLVDNRDVHEQAFRVFASRLGYTIDEEVFKRMSGRGNEEIIPEIMPREALEEYSVESLAQMKEEVYREIFTETITPTPGLLPFMDEIRRRGYKTAIGSSGILANVRFVIEKCGIADKFDVVVHGGMVERCKPWPDIYVLVCRMLGLAPAECLVIEDAPAGIEAARLTGTHIAALATTFPRERLLEERTDLLLDNFLDFDPDMIAGIE